MSKNKWMTKLTKDFGKTASDLADDLKKVNVLPTRSVSLNWATAMGGIVPGKVSIFYGPESSGKTLIAMMAVADLLKRDPDAIVVWFDAEFSFSPNMFKKLGGDLDRLVVRQSSDPITIFDYIGGDLKEALQEGAPIKGVVIDSIKSIRYPKDNKKVTTDMTMGGTGSAYLPSALKLIIPIINEFKLLSIFIQQVTAQIDPMKAMRNPFVITEGHALKHAADIMMEITRLDTKNGVVEDEHGRQIGHKIRVKVKKNRMGPPARKAEFLFAYDSSTVEQKEKELFDLAVSVGVIFHPKKDGRPNAMMWEGAGRTIRGEAGMVEALKDPNYFQAILKECESFVDKREIKVDENGVVLDSEDSDSSEESELEFLP